MIIEKRIIINNGQLFMADGSDLQQYLIEWQLEQGIANGTIVNVLDNKIMEDVYEAAVLAKYGFIG